VEPRLKELAYLKTSIVNGCQYCTQAHTASAKRAGITEQQIQEIFFYDRSQAFDDKEKVTLLFAEQVTRGAATQPAVQPHYLLDHCGQQEYQGQSPQRVSSCWYAADIYTRARLAT